jgi:hypothetical protein
MNQTLANLCYILIDARNIGIIWQRKDLNIISLIFGQPFFWSKYKLLSIGGGWCPCFLRFISNILPINKTMEKMMTKFGVNKICLK